MGFEAQEVEVRDLALDECELRVEDDLDPRVVGFGIVYERWSQDLGGFKEIVHAGAATDAIKDADVRGLFNHNANYVLGRTKAGTMTLEESDRGVKYSISPPDAEWARGLMASIKRKDITGSSFSFRVAKDGDKWTEPTGKGPYLREITKLSMVADMGPVTFPAYTQTTAQVRSLVAASGVDPDGLPGLLLRIRRGGPITREDRDLIQASIGALQQILPSDAGRGSGVGVPTADQPQGRLALLQRQLQIARARLI